MWWDLGFWLNIYNNPAYYYTYRHVSLYAYKEVEARAATACVSIQFFKGFLAESLV